KVNEPPVSKEVTLPWIVKDLVDFTEDQKAARAESDKKIDERVGSFLRMESSSGSESMLFGLLGFDGRLQLPSLWSSSIIRKVKGFQAFFDSFALRDTVGSWTALKYAGGNLLDLDSPLTRMKEQRDIPSHVFYLEEAQTYPTWVKYEKLHAPDGTELKGVRGIATIYLDTFSPSTGEDEVVEEFSRTLETLNAQGVNDIIIDMINNGGGSLSLGMRLAQLLSNEKVVMPQIQFRLSESWLDQFEAATKNGFDSEKEIARRTYETLIGQTKQQQRLSSPFYADILVPTQIQPHSELTTKFNVVLLVNEMCASMCDIFTAILKDNQLATVVGSKTMGAGGNVTSHYQAPNSHLDINQTESLILRADGSYIENNGIEPDVSIEVNQFSDSKYSEVWDRAVELLTEVKP
ncbi:MAG: S41 family peptidase, partial [Bdellovibrionia bacterium]